ncbi:MAG: TlpA family protein disulfide reductase [Desulfobacteria bacterium]|nr:redoxin domain-containing protein [Deltaproteobacteria bacterium]HQT98704.1 redoxin domain-containing protein [Thermodesulfobacteriota bacterium]
MKKVLLILLVLCFGLAAAAFAAEEAPKPEIKYGINVGDNIKPVTVSSIDGAKKVKVDKVANKTLFLMISSVCTACKTEIQEISSNIDRFKGKLDVYAVVIDMDPKAASQRLGNVPFPLLADSEYAIGNATNLMSTPSALIVEGGKILYSKAGYRTDQWKEYLK